MSGKGRHADSKSPPGSVEAEKTGFLAQIPWLHAAVVAIILGVPSFFYFQILPMKIETGISESKSLQDKFDRVKESIDRLEKSVSPFIVSRNLREETSGTPENIAKNIPAIRDQLKQIKAKRIPVPAHDYKEISNNLSASYLKSKPPLSREIWEVIVELAATRSSTESILNPLPEQELARAKQSGKFIENADIDLSLNVDWNDFIFSNCRIAISDPIKELSLAGVRFIDCEFSGLSDNWVSRKLLSTIVESLEPTVTGGIAIYRVDVKASVRPPRSR